MVYGFFEKYEDENDERMTHKYGDNYRYVKRLYPNAYKLPKKEIEEMIDIARWHGDTLEEGQAELDKYIKKNEADWQQLYFGGDADNKANMGLEQNAGVGKGVGFGQNANAGSQQADSQAHLNPQKAMMKKAWEQSGLNPASTFDRPLSQNKIETGMEDWAKTGNKAQPAFDNNTEKQMSTLQNPQISGQVDPAEMERRIKAWENIRKKRRQQAYDDRYPSEWWLDEAKKLALGVDAFIPFYATSYANDFANLLFTTPKPLFLRDVNHPEWDNIPQQSAQGPIDATKLNADVREYMLHAQIPHVVHLKPRDINKVDKLEKLEEYIPSVGKLYDPTWKSYSCQLLGARAVHKYNDLIEAAAQKYDVDPDLIRAAMYIENRDGHKGGLNPMADIIDRSESLLPMNIQTKRWSDLGDNDFDMDDPAQNIEAAALLLKRLQGSLEDPNDIEALGTLWNSGGAQSINSVGQRIAYAYKNKPWDDPYYKYFDFAKLLGL